MNTGTKKSELALHVSGLSKRFGEKKAVDHIDLMVSSGSFLGLVGPNGAGKTTLLSMVVGLLRPDEGRAHIFGYDIWQDPVRAKTLIGVLPDSMSMPERLTGQELLMYIGLLHRLEKRTVVERSQELLNVLDLTDARQKLVIEYSTGMRKKIGLATALLHAPKLLVLDEPFEAIDPLSAATIKTILQRFVASGGSVVFSSHMMALVEQVCDTVAIMNAGQVIATGPLDEIRGGNDQNLEETFVRLVGGHVGGKEGLTWLVS